jgi:hypothetical protein
MSNFSDKALSKTSWAVEGFAWSFKRSFFKPDAQLTNAFSIGITTFMDRFETCLKPLLAKLSVLFPDCQIIVIANGHVRKHEQAVYISEIEGYCNKFSNVQLITFSEPKGLSSLWNTIIKRSDTSSVLILNDDLRIKERFRSFISASGICDVQIATINRSWSHFMISKSVINAAGWFDENFLEIGGEDDDYLARLAMLGIKPGDFKTDTISRSGRKSRRNPGINSYGRNMSKEAGGYSTLNVKYLYEKWDTSDEYFDGAVEVLGRKTRFWKLREQTQSDVRH